MGRSLDFDYLGFSWSFVLLLVLPFLRTNKFLNPFIFYTWIMAVYTTQNHNYRLDFPIHVLLAGENQCLYVMCFILIFVALMRSTIKTTTIEKILGWVGGTNIILTIMLIPFNEPFISGLAANKSMNAIFTMMLLPYAIKLLPEAGAIWVMLTFCIVLTSNSLSAGLCLLANVVWFFRRNPKSLALGVLMTLVLIFTFIHKTHYYDRLEAWRFFFKTFTQKDYLVGRGPGSFFPFSAYEQVVHKFVVYKNPAMTEWVGEGFYIWLHNDYLQALYEYGIIGFSLLVVGGALYSLQSVRGPLIYSALTIAVGSCFYYLNHYPLHLAVIFCLLKLANNNYIVKTQNQ